MTATTTDVMWLLPGQVTVSLELRLNSALAYCTAVDGDDSGRVSIGRNWPSLSTGEELLWEVLAWLNGHGTYPDLERLRAHLDDTNLRAAMTAVAS